jgi:hypothetical protein
LTAVLLSGAGGCSSCGGAQDEGELYVPPSRADEAMDDMAEDVYRDSDL